MRLNFGASHPQNQVFAHISELYTCEGVRKKDGRRVNETDLGRVEDAALVIEKGRVKWSGPTAKLPREYRKKVLDLDKKHAMFPAFVDCHTHLVFAGNRASEFARRCGGESYESIAQSGGGIQTSVVATRAASEKELLALAVDRVEVARKGGVGILEIKSGYGLSHETELKQLKVAKKLEEKFPRMLFQRTYLGAHAFPREMTREAYIEEICRRTLPEVAKKKWAHACDVFMDRGYFTGGETRKILLQARELGLQIKLHGDELANTEAAALACELGALSVDHLLKVSDRGVGALARSKTVAVLLPGTAFFLKEAYAPARKLIDAGACVAISTDFNPGSCNINSLPAIMTFSALYMQMTKAEILSAATYAGARALGLEKECGTLEVGMPARITLSPYEKFEEIYYRFGAPLSA